MDFPPPQPWIQETIKAIANIVLVEHSTVNRKVVHVFGYAVLVRKLLSDATTPFAENYCCSLYAGQFAVSKFLFLRSLLCTGSAKLN